MLNETTGTVDRARTHDLLITSQTCNPLRHATPFDDNDNGDDHVDDDDTIYDEGHNDDKAMDKPDAS